MVKAYEDQNKGCDPLNDAFALMIEFRRAADAACGYMPPITDITAAVHEGGHAVIGRVLGLPCGGASIEGDHPHASIGHGWMLTRERSHARELVEAYIMASMAGAEAEHILLNYWHEGHTDEMDQQHIRRLAKTIRWPGGWRAARKRLQQRTHELIKQHRDPIRRVALALLKHHRLDGPTIDGIVMPKRQP